MAKSYDFKIRFIRAEFPSPGVARCSISDMFASREIDVVAFNGSLSDAVAKRAELSAKLANPHAAFLDVLQNRGEKAPAGFKKIKQIYGGLGSEQVQQ